MQERKRKKIYYIYIYNATQLITFIYIIQISSYINIGEQQQQQLKIKPELLQYIFMCAT
jgi:hypothetical protein